MSKLPCRVSIAQAVIVVALLRSGSAQAQVGYVAGPIREPGGLVNNLVIGAQYDIMNQAKAERHLPHALAKLRRDVERGHPAAVERDVYRVDSLRYRIAVDEWLIRKNRQCDPGYYPYPLRMDPITCAAIAQYRRPPHAP